MEIIPPETIEEIALKLNYADLISLASTNKKFFGITNNDIFWKHYLKIHYLPLVDENFMSDLTNNNLKYIDYIKYLRTILDKASIRRLFFTSGAIEIITKLRSLVDDKVNIDLMDILEYGDEHDKMIDISYFFAPENAYGELCDELYNKYIDSHNDFIVPKNINVNNLNDDIQNNFYSDDTVKYINFVLNYINKQQLIITLDDVYTANHNLDRMDLYFEVSARDDEDYEIYGITAEYLTKTIFSGYIEEVKLKMLTIMPLTSLKSEHFLYALDNL